MPFHIPKTTFCWYCATTIRSHPKIKTTCQIGWFGSFIHKLEKSKMGLKQREAATKVPKKPVKKTWKKQQGHRRSKVVFTSGNVSAFQLWNPSSDSIQCQLEKVGFPKLGGVLCSKPFVRRSHPNHDCSPSSFAAVTMNANSFLLQQTRGFCLFALHLSILSRERSQRLLNIYII